MSGRAQQVAVSVNEQNQNHLARSQHFVENSSPAEINRQVFFKFIRKIETRIGLILNLILTIKIF